jgi:argininosuccinate lyase
VDTVKDSLAAFADLVGGIEPRPEAMRAAAAEGFSTATDLADYLVRKGVPFRDAHETVAHAVREAEATGCDLADLPLAVLKGFSRAIGEDVYAALTLEGSVAARDHAGGTAPRQVRKAIARARARLAADR